MNPKMLKLMKAKKKREVDPNAPPRPNLLSHEKVLKNTKLTIEQMAIQLNRLQQRLDATESKLRYQTQYLAQLHNVMSRKK